ncbi:DUF4123 domain-containing protein [Providencia sp. PROV212]|uniref:DUF4123 domain-containing protein n=1 Tax=Providencia sp. PROV212 TaxID=2949909 RepID=UPI00234A3D41|nr:DUF4123 domain-containing protein [Providencia sp. PROV212]
MNNITANSKENLITYWIKQLKEHSLSYQLNYIDIIIDLAGYETSIIPALKTIDHQLQWFSLFTGLPEENYIDQSPILIRIEWDKPKQQLLLHEIFKLFICTPRFLALLSYINFNKLSRYLQKLSEASYGNQVCLFRFYDSRIFPELMRDILNEEQRNYFSKVAKLWGWMDRNNEVNWLVCDHKIEFIDDIQPNIILTDTQLNRLGCISDASLFIDDNLSITENKNAEDIFSDIYALAIEANNSEYLGDFESYINKYHPQFLN